ncbi:MAG: hypothetical protein KF774_13210 [Planctomyces sp.]|nr:hypothetical protein [Planctomyces sp.]
MPTRELLDRLRRLVPIRDCPAFPPGLVIQLDATSRGLRIAAGTDGSRGAQPATRTLRPRGATVRVTRWLLSRDADVACLAAEARRFAEFAARRPWSATVLRALPLYGAALAAERDRQALELLRREIDAAARRQRRTFRAAVRRALERNR